MQTISKGLINQYNIFTIQKWPKSKYVGAIEKISLRSIWTKFGLIPAEHWQTPQGYADTKVKKTHLAKTPHKCTQYQQEYANLH